MPGDIVTHFDGILVETAEQLSSLLSGAIPSAGDTPDEEIGGMQMDSTQQFPLQGQEATLRVSRIRSCHVELTKRGISNNQASAYGLTIGTPTNASRTPWSGLPTYILHVDPTGPAAASGLCAVGARIDTFNLNDVMSPSGVDSVPRESQHT
ncbi:MAG: hypothetical protein SGPRY_008043 [Prymnesium sp.]